jgi:hypothetical protein
MNNQIGYLITACGFTLGILLYGATVFMHESPAQLDYNQKEQMALVVSSQVNTHQLLQRRIALQRKMIINYTQEIRDLAKLGLDESSPEVSFAREKLSHANEAMNQCYYELNACGIESNK